MHRMRRFIVLTGLVALTSLLGGSRASAGLLHPPSTEQQYPDIAANLGKGVSYSYDPSTQHGVFHLRNLALALDNGTSVDDSKFYDIAASSTGSRVQELQVMLDKQGNFVDNVSNSYSLSGKVTVDTGNGLKTYDGLLLAGKPINFASVDTIIDGEHYTQFQADLKITDGKLADLYGANSFIHLVAEAGSSFNGKWDEDFKITKISSNTKGPGGPGQPFPVPEPTALVLLAVSGAGLVYRNRKRLV